MSASCRQRPRADDEHLNSFDNSLENRGLQNSFIEPGPGWSQASMSPSRMFKAFTSEGGIRAPFVVKLPGAMPHAGTMNHSFFHVRDIMPTVLDAAGLEHPQEIDGRRVAPLHGTSVLDLFAGDVATPSIEVGRREGGGRHRLADLPSGFQLTRAAGLVCLQFAVTAV